MKNQWNFQHLVNTMQSQRAAKIITILLALLLTATLLRFLIVFLPPGKFRPTQVMVQPLPEISQWHLFGSYLGTGYLPITQLNINLEGIFYSPLSQQSHVLISTPGLRTKVYSVGQEIFGGVFIEEILRDYVILDHNGVLEKLPLRIPKLQFAPPPTVTDIAPQ